MKKIHSLPINSLRLIAHEHVLQLEKQDNKLNVFKKQISLEETMNEIILVAKTSAKGQVQVVFTDQPFSDRVSVEDVLLNSNMGIIMFNTDKRNGVLFRTVIVVDHLWSADFKVYQAQYGLSNKYLKPYEGPSK